MATIVTEAKITNSHKEHRCLDDFTPFLRGLFTFANYCPKCGENLIEQKDTIERRCSECQQILFSFGRYFKYQYCPNCGARFE